MPPTWRIDLLHLGGWDWAPGFEMSWMEAGAPDGPLALVSLPLRDGESTVLVNTGPDVTMLPELNQRWAEFDPRHQLRVADEQPLEDQLSRRVTDKWDQVRLLEDEEELRPGLSVFRTGAHHRSSLAVKVATGQGAVIGSDCFMRPENITQNRPLGINESLAETLAAYDRIRRRPTFSCPSTTLLCSSSTRTESVPRSVRRHHHHEGTRRGDQYSRTRASR